MLRKVGLSYSGGESSSMGPGKQRGRGARMSPRYRSVYVIFFCIIIIGLVITGALQFWPHSIEEDSDLINTLRSTEPLKEIVITKEHPKPERGDLDCTFHTCFDVYHCGYNDDNRITVYVYPPAKYLDENNVPITLPVSREFHEIVQTVADSIYYTTDPEKACLFLPPLDLLNQNSIRLEETAQILKSLPRWNGGSNHLLFNMLPGSAPDYNTVLDVNKEKAVMAGGGFSTWTYRRTYDVAIPVFNPLAANIKLPEKSYLESRHWLLISAQTGLHAEYREDLTSMRDTHSAEMLLLDKCEDRTPNFTERCDQEGKLYPYPQILQEATFCLVIRGSRLGQTALSDVMKAGCIPVISADSFILPFSEVLDWKRLAIVVPEESLMNTMSVLKKISMQRIYNMRKQAKHVWHTYFSSMHAITLTTLQIINDRVFPYAAKKYEDWNDLNEKGGISNPLFLPLLPPKAQGFTAVILTYDRLESLFKIIQQVSLAPSLAKVLIVWNNQQKPPPQASVWPKISKPLKVVQTRANKLSNRFYPYDEIETEAILSLDDDILMLTTDELEFGYEVWREFPDRLVGFPSRLHLWDNTTGRWKYESEWTSDISLVLSGAAFYHKYYSFLYTNAMPGNIKFWVDEHMNCEDIALNFLISNTTGKPPIKVTPRQKFKCPECQNLGLSADLSHMVERSECISRFADIYGTMPLKTVGFRADPVLYKDNFPPMLKRFNDVGAL